MNELQHEIRSVSCSFPDPGVQHHDCNESNMYQLLPGGHYSSIISSVNMHFHLAKNISNDSRLEKAGERQVQVCYNDIVPILIPTTYNYYKHNLEISLWIQEYLITDYFEKEKRIRSNIQDTSQDLVVL